MAKKKEFNRLMERAIQNHVHEDFEWQDPGLHDIDRAELYARKRGLAEYYIEMARGAVRHFLVFLILGIIAVGVLIYSLGTSPKLKDADLKEMNRELQELVMDDETIASIHSLNAISHTVVVREEEWQALSASDRQMLCEFYNEMIALIIQDYGWLDADEYASVTYVMDNGEKVGYPTSPPSSQELFEDGTGKE